MLYAVTLWQPFASLVVYSRLGVLSFADPVTHRGPVAIYATPKAPAALATIDADPAPASLLGELRAYVDALPGAPRAADLPRGALLGVAWFGPCVQAGRLTRALLDAEYGARALRVTNVADGRYVCPIIDARPCDVLPYTKPAGTPPFFAVPPELATHVATSLSLAPVRDVPLNGELRRMLDLAAAPPPRSLDTPPDPPARA